ncbi:hypothetical protein ID866_6081 [Astraeus odoratus]|nr:hypothetical protein ID866_6081 [Astraeus odoratus]
MEMKALRKVNAADREEIRRRRGYRKILKCCEQAFRDGIQLVWVDTCGIDRRSNAKLSEAINGMYPLYANSNRCYAYIHDINESNGWPKWFSRGWTLQELVAPRDVHFFNRKWEPIGSKRCLAPILQNITGIPKGILEDGLPSNRDEHMVDQIKSWAVDRKTTREEDMKYCLFGLLGKDIPMVYEEEFRHQQERRKNIHSCIPAREKLYGQAASWQMFQVTSCVTMRTMQCTHFAAPRVGIQTYFLLQCTYHCRISEFRWISGLALAHTKHRYIGPP